jgi:hypothetical protein
MYLDESTLDLTDVDGGIDAVADVGDKRRVQNLFIYNFYSSCKSECLTWKSPVMTSISTTLHAAPPTQYRLPCGSSLSLRVGLKRKKSIQK